MANPQDTFGHNCFFFPRKSPSNGVGTPSCPFLVKFSQHVVPPQRRLEAAIHLIAGKTQTKQKSLELGPVCWLSADLQYSTTWIFRAKSVRNLRGSFHLSKYNGQERKSFKVPRRHQTQLHRNTCAQPFKLLINIWKVLLVNVFLSNLGFFPLLSTTLISQTGNSNELYKRNSLNEACHHLRIQESSTCCVCLQTAVAVC